ncbi:MAG: hypothetical protein RJA70_4422 [Pseudomonadota bacterium]|jgi:hypothetical protein
MDLTALQWGLCLSWIALSAYGEGYRAFQLRFAPRVVVRALYLAHHPKPLHVLLAPLFCMGFFHASKRGKILAWGTTLMVLCFILLLRQVPQPWRGIVDGGVVVALLWGSLAIVVFYVKAFFRNQPPNAPALLPEAPNE